MPASPPICPPNGHLLQESFSSHRYRSYLCSSPRLLRLEHLPYLPRAGHPQATVGKGPIALACRREHLYRGKERSAENRESPSGLPKSAPSSEIRPYLRQLHSFQL